MGSNAPTRNLILAELVDHEPKSQREIVKATGLSEKSVYNALFRCWKRGLVLRTKKPVFEFERIFKGRGGLTQNTRPYHLYLLKPKGKNSVRMGGQEFVKYDMEYLDARGGGKLSKAQRVFDFIKKAADARVLTALAALTLTQMEENEYYVTR